MSSSAGGCQGPADHFSFHWLQTAGDELWGCSAAGSAGAAMARQGLSFSFLSLLQAAGNPRIQAVGMPCSEQQCSWQGLPGSSLCSLLQAAGQAGRAPSGLVCKGVAARLGSS